MGEEVVFPFSACEAGDSSWLTGQSSFEAHSLSPYAAIKGPWGVQCHPKTPSPLVLTVCPSRLAPEILQAPQNGSHRRLLTYAPWSVCQSDSSYMWKDLGEQPRDGDPCGKAIGSLSM